MLERFRMILKKIAKHAIEGHILRRMREEIEEWIARGMQESAGTMAELLASHGMQ